MSAVVLPVAHHLIAAVPFVAPMMLVVIGLAVLMIRDRMGSPDRESGDPPSSRA